MNDGFIAFLFSNSVFLLVSRRVGSTSCLHPPQHTCKTVDPSFSPLDTGAHVGEPVFDALLIEAGREGGVKMDRGREGGSEMSIQGFSPHTHILTHTHKHTRPHPHLAAPLLSVLSPGLE